MHFISIWRFTYFNKKTKKNEKIIYNSYYNSNASKDNKIGKIRILKRHESLSHTLKNILGIKTNYDNLEISSINNNENEIENAIADLEIEEIIDMDNEYDEYGNKRIDCNNESNNDSNNNINDNGNNGNNNINDNGNNDTSNGNNVDKNDMETFKEITTNRVILIQRKHTIGFIEFIRGKYDVNNPEYIIKLFNMMTFDEKRLLREYNNFDTIRLVIGLKRDLHYKNEYDDAKQKYTELQKNNLINKLLDKSYTKWTSPEWGLPKGRRNYKEYEIECAIREFSEETGIKYKYINVYRNVKPLEEIYKGINGVVYKHIYYLASIKENTYDNITASGNTIDNSSGNIQDIIEKIENNITLHDINNIEIGNVKTFSLTECHKLIRPYYISKLNVIKKGFQIINSLENFLE